MRTIAHLSDLHFGRTEAKVVRALLLDLEHHRPDLVIISGDLTQRARSHQFAEARAFLSHIPAPALVVPGNHDLYPLYRPLARLFRPRAKFHRNLPGHDVRPVWADSAVVAMGLDSTRSLRWKSGALKDSHLDHLETTLAEANPKAARVVFMHHPPATTSGGHPYETLVEHGIDLVLTGHVHHAHVELINGEKGGSLVLVQATTACSTRLREDSNGYCLVRLDGDHMEVGVQGWSGEVFHTIRHHWFEKRYGVWRGIAHPTHVFPP
ncbi:phosphohydrolase [Paramagnetospirillum marisnigri]|uniref:Phosphohydrolase n=1 Tax=Paramagnetospirillum marisnigri TaxID=1285242 RepID=A0A178M7A9_9PROT|nr:metallophosphoesterase [Paramagnetospirillum marisnigri]OAN43938.1 phosphohydrolase [Paramagnetospirillum marisnigri]